MSKNTCVIWDSLFPNQYWGDKSSTIFNKEEYGSFDFSEVQIIYILAELKWEEYKRTDFHGFKIAKNLRGKENLLCPIVICSFMPDFDKSHHPDSKILNTPGHYLLHLPQKPLEFSHYKAIDDDTLYDINYSIFDTEGMLHNLMHDLVNSCNTIASKISDNDELSTQIQKLTKTRLSDFKENILDEKKASFTQLINTILAELTSEIFENPDLEKSDIIGKIFNTYKDQIYAMLPVALSDKEERDFPPKRWSILFIDDMEDFCLKVKDKFEDKKRGGITCLTANNADDAFQILKIDEKEDHKIAVIISDFRLYENGNDGKWQRLQGFQILKTVHEDGENFKSHYAYSILTSKLGTILDKIKQRSEFPVLWFYKADVLNNDAAFNIFYQRICEAGSEAFFRKHNIPNAAVWLKGNDDRVDIGLHYFYKQHIESPDFDAIEREINRKAINNINEVESKNKLSDKFKYQIALVFKEKKGKIEITNNAYELLTRFRENTLVVRRIYWGLRILLGLDSEDIYKIFKNKKGDKRSMDSIFNTSLGISYNEDISNKKRYFLKRYGLLNEEMEFVEKYGKTYGVDPDYIRLTNKEIESLTDFFSPLANFEEIPKASSIAKKIKWEVNAKISIEEFSASVNELYQRKFSDGVFNRKFKQATELFYLHFIDDLSDEIRKKLLKLKHWQ